MLTSEQCRKIIGPGPSDDELALVRTALYGLADVVIDIVEGGGSNSPLETETKVCCGAGRGMGESSPKEGSADGKIQ